jgi:hypothetical protein
VLKNVPSDSSALSKPFDREEYLESLLLLVCRRKLPFNVVTWPEFQRYSRSLNPSIGSSLISSRKTLVAHIAKAFSFYRGQLRKKLQKANSLIHFSADLWTAPNRTGFVGVHAQWVDEDYSLQNMLIGLPECQSSHSGPQQAGYIMELVRWYNIGRNLGFFTADNASSNDTCLQAISMALHNDYKVSGSIPFRYL